MTYPLIDSLRLSLFTIDSSNVERFVGLKNYLDLLTSPDYAPRFWGALQNNIIFFLVHMLVQNPIGLLLATMLTTKGKGRKIYRVIIFMPTVLSFVIVGFIWNLILSPLWGVAESILKAVGLGALFRPWLGLENSALITISLISVWQFVGIPMVLFYAALIGIPEEIIEAARVDGANNWQIFWKIKFPLVLPTVGIVGILTFVGNFNAFDLVYTIKGALAGPNFSTDLMGTLFYRTFFGQQLQIGNPTLGAAVAGMMFIIILTGVMFYTFVWQKRVRPTEL